MADILKFQSLAKEPKKDPKKTPSSTDNNQTWAQRVDLMSRYLPLNISANTYAMMLMEATSIMDFGVRAAPEVLLREICPADGIHEGFLVPFPYLGEKEYSCHIQLLDIDYGGLPVPVLGFHNNHIYTMLTDMEKDMGVKYSLVTEYVTRKQFMEWMSELKTLNTETLLIFNICVNLALTSWADDYLPLA